MKTKRTETERLEHAVITLTEQVGMLVQAIDELRTEVQWLSNNRENRDEVGTG